MSDKNFRIHSLSTYTKGSPVHAPLPKEGRVAPAGAENEAIQKSTGGVSTDDDDNLGKIFFAFQYLCKN